MDEFLSTAGGVFVFAILNAFIFFYILYLVIKAAIKSANRELKQEESIASTETHSVLPPVWSTAQIEIQSKYDKGEISLEEYKKRWKELS